MRFYYVKILSVLFFTTNLIFSQVLITEVMYDLVGTDSPSEFIELYNSSPTSTVDLTNWTISDKNSTDDFVDTGDGLLLPPLSYAVIFEGDYNFTIGIYSGIIPVGTIKIQVDDNSIGNSLSTTDSLYLRDDLNNLIDSVGWTDIAPDGHSIERVRLDLPNTADNWVASIDLLGTPGATNSVAPLNIDGAILAQLTIHNPEFPHLSESISLNIGVINNGIETLSGSVSILLGEINLGSGQFTLLNSEDTTFVNLNIDPLASGNNLLKIKLDVAGDMILADNLIEHNVYVSYPFAAVTFNEFLAAPDTTQAEFIEIINFNDIDLTDWAISDETLSKHYFSNFLAAANQPIVIASDSTFIATLPSEILVIIPDGGLPTLNNSADALFLFDATGTIIDSLHYDSDWPLIAGRSTEKFRPEFESDNLNRWGVAVNADAMTPGLVNSLHFDELPISGSIIFENNPFSPNGDGIDDELLIKYKLPFEQGILKLQIFDMTGRIIASPYWNVHFPQEGLLKWNGKRGDGSNARIGIYIMKLTAKDPASGKVWEKIKTVVLAKQL